MEAVNVTRRRLMQMAKYVPPIVIGAISLQQAGCQPDPTCSCAPSPASCGTPTPKPAPSDKANTDLAPET
ncbi:MAG: hypothetical protein IPQ07_36215 [Myxococcales bacterium]|nr:hypothetical protein [Myxococcales bacterium]